MNTKVLNIVETAYRATLEEQDDTVIWFLHALRGAGAPADLLLRGNAVNYAVKEQDAAGLAFGERRQTHPPELAGDLAKLMEKQVRVIAVTEDLDQRGIAQGNLIPKLEFVSRSELPGLVARYERVWHW